MKKTKKIGKIVIFTVLTIAVLFYLLPNVAYIEQMIEVRATSDKVFELINRPENWVEWYSPVMDSSTVKLSFFGRSEGKGAGMKWESSDPMTSEGIMYIRNSKNNRNVSANITINDKRSNVMNFNIRPVGIDASMLTISSRLRFRQDSILHFLRLMFDRSDELQIIDYLENIDAAAIEKTGGIDVHLQRIDPFSYIYITDSCAVQDIQQRKNMLFVELLIFAAKSGIELTVRPIVVYHRLDEKFAVFEVGMPVAAHTPVSGNIRFKTMPGGEKVVANYYGEYDTLEDGHNAIQHWLMRYRRKQDGVIWETYITDPTDEPDPNKWLTRIYYPVK